MTVPQQDNSTSFRAENVNPNSSGLVEREVVAKFGARSASGPTQSVYRQMGG